MIKNIIFDFDGVILNSMPIRDFGFTEIFKKYPQDLVDQLLTYHNENGGLSRFVKIKYFYNKILGNNISEKKILDYSDSFSKIMKKELVNKKYLIDDTLIYIKDNFSNFNMHIASGSEESELKYLCSELGIQKYFKSINGSPIHKNVLVKNILSNYNYSNLETVLIGDSINDYQAAEINKLSFYGYNNVALKAISNNYIESFSSNLLYK